MPPSNVTTVSSVSSSLAAEMQLPGPQQLVIRLGSTPGRRHPDSPPAAPSSTQRRSPAVTQRHLAKEVAQPSSLGARKPRRPLRSSAFLLAAPRNPGPGQACLLPPESPSDSRVYPRQADPRAAFSRPLPGQAVGRGRRCHYAAF
eukprot:CAMPEP_0204299258 /NCGR_PEP_ID=MMETSP0468-20130131/76446_1 /ASSEMBLY_ACC=CAM_ASM_000383 /TAXON_ID=2969 /ORGANISM="Oxyrrhis marina" /LENGTH=144 /DNA_ID=CAMNT_0051278229 /DNA_START=267 /DNA_END=702 /DNA_ORIENTATION=-